jgi:hypothetical protein
MTMRMTMNKVVGFAVLIGGGALYRNRMRSERTMQLVREQKQRDEEAMQRIRQGGDIADRKPKNK